jgi:hypothetical protein
VAPSTVPLTTREPSANLSAVFVWLSLGGFAVVVLMALVQSVLTRPGRHRWTL